MNLSDAFSRVAHKRLARVDLPDGGSNQHEINGVAALREFFAASETLKGTAVWVRFADDVEPEPVAGEFTFYDARARSAETTRRTEWRFYYNGEPLAGAKVGDLLVLAQTVKDELFALVFEQGSGWERAALELFPIAGTTGQMQILSSESVRCSELDLLRRTILDQLGIDYAVPEDELTGLVIERFGFAFPPTVQMGALAREHVSVDGLSPDDTLWMWLDTEERLFRALERVIVGDRLTHGFETVEDFLSYSLSVQNRRKSRMGHALEHHLAAVFDNQRLRYSRQVRTEGNRTADFVFPGVTEYHDATFPVAGLTVLAAKSTCKDRWPQVLADADRIPTKHLCTLDTALSGFQIADMLSKAIVPVMPERIRRGYAAVPRADAILTVSEFVGLVSGRAS